MNRSTMIGLGVVGLLAVVGIAAIVIVQQTLNDPTRRSAEADRMDRFYVQDATERLAVCNDGTPAVYYHRPGSGENADKWIIHLQGGGSCQNEAECIERWERKHHLMSSSDDGKKATSSGIMLPDEQINPDFHDFNHVRISYCSSDSWAGDTVTTIDGNDVEFRGSRIVQAVIEDLQNDEIHTGVNLSDATELLFTGSSAGGAGVVKNLDRVQDMLPHVTVKGVDDSAWNVVNFVGVYNEDNVDNVHTTDLEEREAIFTDFHNQQFDESCVEEHPDEPLSCAGIIASYPYIETPIFVYIDQLDNNQVGKTGVTKPYDEDEEAYLETFASGIRESLTERAEHAFSTRTGKHTALTTKSVFTLEVDGLSYYDVLTNWYFEREGPTFVVED